MTDTVDVASTSSTVDTVAVPAVAAPVVIHEIRLRYKDTAKYLIWPECPLTKTEAGVHGKGYLSVNPDLKLRAAINHQPYGNYQNVKITLTPMLNSGSRRHSEDASTPSAVNATPVSAIESKPSKSKRSTSVRQFPPTPEIHENGVAHPSSTGDKQQSVHREVDEQEPLFQMTRL